jgi:hypothetical protein
MSTVAAHAPLPKATKSTASAAKIAVSTAIVLIAVAFVLKYVFRYYLNYNQTAFNDPIRGAANYWRMRGWLLMHITGGMIAVLSGPWQFWTGFRVRYARLHRATGYIFLSGVAIGSVGSVRMAISTTGNWANMAWELALAFAWVTTTAMAYYAILNRNVAVHKEWMVRAYVVTFAFVTFRLLYDYSPLSRIGPDSDRSNTIGWACWAIPLLVTEVIMQLRRMRKPV